MQIFVYMRHLMIAILTLLLLPFLTACLSADEYRTWTSASGKYTTEATLKEICTDGKSVLLKKRNGKMAKVVIEQLCDDDKAYISKKSDNPFTGDGEKTTSSVSTPAETASKKPTASQSESSDSKTPNNNKVPPLVTYPYEVSLGNTLEDIRSRCNIIDEEYDQISNWRIVTIKPKNEALEKLTVIFRNESTLGFYSVSFRNPTKKLAISVYKNLKTYFNSPNEFKFDDSDKRKETASCHLYKKPDGSNAFLYYSNEKGSEESLSFSEKKAKPEIPESLKKVLLPVAKEAVLDRLKAPSTAVFVPDDKTVYEPGDTGKGFILYIGVDAQNSYGAMLRARYAVTVDYKNGVASVDDGIYDVLEVKRGEKYIDALIRTIKEE